MLRKPSEFAINSFASMMTVTQYDDLELLQETKTFNENYPCHIYAICRRPRVSIVTEKFKRKGNSLFFGFKVQHQDKFSDLEIEIPNPFGKVDVKVESEFPHNIFDFVSKKGRIKAKTATFLQTIPRHMFKGDFLDLEVLYVGQSYGVKGARTAPERLKKHETLQAIYAEALSKNPDQEIWLMLFSFEQLGIAMFDGRTKFSEKQKEEDKSRAVTFFNTFSNGGITEQQFINFTEAALIRYFRPPYNKDYINTFPNPAHTTYKECYDLDVNSVVIELGTMDSVNLMMYSNAISKQVRHFGKFLIHNKKERKSMFDYSDM